MTDSTRTPPDKPARNHSPAGKGSRAEKIGAAKARRAAASSGPGPHKAAGASIVAHAAGTGRVAAHKDASRKPGSPKGGLSGAGPGRRPSPSGAPDAATSKNPRAPRPGHNDAAQDTARKSGSIPGKPERIAKVLARAGIASRRDAELLIAEGKVAVNGAVIDSPALNVAATDRISVDGVPLAPPAPARLWLYYKPDGLVTTTRDEKGRETVFDALPADLPRVMSVGRLDLNSEGLLLLTNDGEIKRRLELPATGWLRRYRVRIKGNPSTEALEPLRRGVTVEGERFQPMEVTLDRHQGANAWLTIGLREGRNREIRRALMTLGIEVNRLIRVSFGPFRLGVLKPGEVEEVKGRVLRDQLGLGADADGGGGEGWARPGARARSGAGTKSGGFGKPGAGRKAGAFGKPGTGPKSGDFGKPGGRDKPVGSGARNDRGGPEPHGNPAGRGPQKRGGLRSEAGAAGHRSVPKASGMASESAADARPKRGHVVRRAATVDTRPSPDAGVRVMRTASQRTGAKSASDDGTADFGRWPVDHGPGSDRQGTGRKATGRTGDGKQGVGQPSSGKPRFGKPGPARSGAGASSAAKAAVGVRDKSKATQDPAGPERGPRKFGGGPRGSAKPGGAKPGGTRPGGSTPRPSPKR